ncbi:hypothetical protein BABINDRAFT_79702 [Babjeviella inositovora NRRL Y-12698]|uniref:Uncharacterized protein n=1 Tax=Babjeviella inositovora NRRL Y-12698 TaxID=984486 RepID=A0A1E3R0V2_9ASCO|nr:uncharacterized protein BABINDRAFT_79702 [Babjeviella inositovora NRRL Y-12698]ODQ83017.1 hypothetical protein BABINDRAFT_79702 [Babjeviella inositovora NRRL Y-12698]
MPETKSDTDSALCTRVLTRVRCVIIHRFPEKPKKKVHEKETRRLYYSLQIWLVCLVGNIKATRSPAYLTSASLSYPSRHILLHSQ